MHLDASRRTELERDCGLKFRLAFTQQLDDPLEQRNSLRLRCAAEGRGRGARSLDGAIDILDARKTDGGKRTSVAGSISSNIFEDTGATHWPST